ncbi:hypothetical protein ABOZ73_07965 [Caulobacter sp. 73W]|uniref:Plasmid stabilization protein n=1 Tax=Caulobacter sp. 73W TaxID=3161137 RepID=A0AB39KX65_9CAUL
MNERLIRAAVPPSFATLWDQLVEDAGSEAEVLRRLLIMVQARSQAPLKGVSTMPEPVILTIKVSKRDALAAERLAAQAGFKRVEWIRALISHRVNASPQFSKEELRIHASVRYELDRIGAVMRSTAQRMTDLGAEPAAASLMRAYQDARTQLVALRSAMAGAMLYWRVPYE